MPEKCFMCSSHDARYSTLSPEGDYLAICSDCARHIKNSTRIMDNPKFWSEVAGTEN